MIVINAVALSIFKRKYFYEYASVAYWKTMNIGKTYQRIKNRQYVLIT